MKQMIVLCSSDLSDTVREALITARVEGFVEVPGAVGHKPGAASDYGRFPRWEAEMFLAPMPDEAVERVLGRLREFANKCETEPCLRILVSTLDTVY